MARRIPTSVPGVLRSASQRAPIWKQKSFYHSYEHSQTAPFAPAESAILSASLSHVPNYGFTSAALKLGARDAGYLDVSTNLLPRGVFDLVNYHVVTQRLALRNAVQFPADDADGKKMGTGAKVRALTLARLRANAPIVHRWQEVRLLGRG
jgi:ubiquinone biosynthesis protein COQ9